MARPDIASDSASPERSIGRVARNRLRIAWMYYVEGLTQNEIADKLGIGRVTVVRNINEALKNREVKIWIEGDISDCVELERGLKEKFGFSDAIVVPKPANPAHVPKSIGMATGMYVTEQLTDDFVVGVGWGATLFESLQSLAPRKFSRLEVVSLLGGIVEAKRYNPADFAWQFADTVGADCYLLAAPAIVDSPQTREALVERCGLATVFAHAEKMDLALLSAGNMAKQSTSFRFGFLSEEERSSLLAKGAVGDLLYNFFDVNGNLVDHPINTRVVSMPVDRLRHVPKRVLAAGGLDKLDTIRGAVKLVNINVLITDEETAQALLG
jgi:deoxyribonucleoside regulator